MNQAEKDAEQWQRKHQEAEYRRWIQATETGTPYYINQYGDVILEKDKKEDSK